MGFKMPGANAVCERGLEGVEYIARRLRARYETRTARVTRKIPLPGTIRKMTGFLPVIFRIC